MQGCAFYFLLRQFQKFSKILENSRCDLKKPRFRLVTYSVAASNSLFNLIIGNFSTSFWSTFAITSYWKWSYFQNFISQRNSQVSSSKCRSDYWGFKRKCPAIFLSPFLIYLKKSSLLLFCKTLLFKGFYNISASV